MNLFIEKHRSYNCALINSILCGKDGLGTRAIYEDDFDDNWNKVKKKGLKH